MRSPWIQASTALKERLRRPIQLDTTEPESEMPPYMELFLSHLRLVVGVPFDYLVPDDRLLPDESIRFFYIDRSWTSPGPRARRQSAGRPERTHRASDSTRTHVLHRCKERQ